MKKLLAVLTALALLPVAVQAYTFSSYSHQIELGEMATERIEATVVTDEPTSQIQLRVSSHPRELRALVDGEEVGTSVSQQGDRYLVTVSPPGELSPNTTHHLTLSFVSESSLERTSRGTLYSSAFRPDVRVESYELSVTLPERASIAFEDDSPLISPTAEINTNGRRITLTWQTSLEAGESFTALVVFNRPGSSLLVPAGLAAVLAGILYLGYRRYRRDGAGRKDETEPEEKSEASEESVPLENVLDTLTGAEREILDVVLDYNGTALQKDVVKELDFSKSKVSKVLRGLEMKGVIDKKPYGRTNRLRIADKYSFKTPEDESEPGDE